MDRLTRTTARIAVGLAALALAQTASAATIPVTSTADNLGASAAVCTLREAISSANTNTAIDGCTAGSGVDTIQLPAGMYVLSVAGTGEDANQTGDLDVTEPVTIEGAGPGSTTIDANHIDRALDFLSGVGPSSISGLTVTNGQVPTSLFGASGDNGGAIRNDSSALTVSHVAITNSAAGAGGPEIAAIPAGSGGSGGGIASGGSLDISDSTVSGNHAGSGGAPMTMLATFGGNGGGIFVGVGSTLTAVRTIVTDNDAGSGSIGGFAGASGGNGGSGGGIWMSGPLTLKDSTISDNTAGNGGAALGNPGGALGSAGGSGGAGGGLADYGAGAIEIAGSTISGNKSGNGGAGGIATLVQGDGGSSGPGGGLELLNAGTTTITDSTITGNQTGNGGPVGAGGGGTGHGGTAAGGGGIDAGRTGTFTISRTTLSNNAVGAPGSGPNALTGLGSAVQFAAATIPTVSNSTISGNTGAAAIGGVLNPVTTIVYSTIADNSAGTGSGALDAGTATTLTNSIVARNTPANCVGTVLDGGHNVSDASCPSAVTTDPLLAPLLDNGGTTLTQIIGATSPAVDLIPKTDPTCALTDQRGITRPQGLGCDAGAVEYVPPASNDGGGGTQQPPASNPPPSGGSNNPPPTSAATDKTAPKVKFSCNKKQKVAKSVKKGLQCVLTTNEAGSATLKAAKFCSGKAKLTKSGKRKLACKFTKKAKKRYAKAKKLKLKLVLVTKDKAGNQTKKTLKLTLKR